MKNISLLVIAILGLILFSCGQAEKTESYALDLPEGIEIEPPRTSESPPPPIAQQIDLKQIDEPQKKQEQPNATSNEPKTVERKLIKNGRIGFQTDDLGKTHQQILLLTKKYKAYIASDETIKYHNQTTHNITVRIPANEFDNFLSEIGEGVKEFDYKEINTEDVTAEYLDVEARIKTKKELENRYLEILQKASTVTDMLEVERQLGAVRSEIESMEGRLKYLKNQVSFSTLNISFYKEVPYEGDSFVDRLGEGLGEGWQGLLMFIVDLTYIWPFLIIFGIVILLLRRFWKNRKKNRNQVTTQNKS
ncbi:MAG: DUF4349 domain-containing protein [Saprospiraceae bacterium]